MIETADYYSVSNVINQDNQENKAELARVCENLVEQLHATSIRPRKGEVVAVDFTVPVDCPVPTDLQFIYASSGNSKHLTKKTLQLQGDTIIPAKQIQGWKHAVVIPENSFQFAAIQQLIRLSNPHWSQIIVNKVDTVCMMNS